MCELMIYSGLRIGETLDLTWSQIDFNKKDILLKNKISKDDEIIPLSDRIIEILNNIPRKTEKVFRWSKNSKSSLNRKFDRCLKDLEIIKNNRSFHNFRKTFRMKLFNAKIPLENAKVLLRHKDIRTTIENYTEYARLELINDINKI
jgi:integrase